MVADAAGQHEQMTRTVYPGVTMIERIKHDPRGIEFATGQQPDETGEWQPREQWIDCLCVANC